MRWASEGWIWTKIIEKSTRIPKHLAFRHRRVGGLVGRMITPTLEALYLSRWADGDMLMPKFGHSDTSLGPYDVFDYPVQPILINSSRIKINIGQQMQKPKEDLLYQFDTQIAWFQSTRGVNQSKVPSQPWAFPAVH